MQIQLFKLDDQVDPCSNSSSKVYIRNCDQILKKNFKPRDNVTIELVYSEDYKYGKMRKTLVIETDMFK